MTKTPHLFHENHVRCAMQRETIQECCHLFMLPLLDFQEASPSGMGCLSWKINQSREMGKYLNGYLDGYEAALRKEHKP